MNSNSLVTKGLLVLSLSITSMFANEVHDEANEASIAKIVISQNMNKKESLTILDRVLSPFEDMTGYALARDISGMKKGYKNIENIEDNAILKQTIPSGKLKILSQDIEKLETYIDDADYTNVALLSSSIFDACITNFKYKNSIQNQIHLEHLDYMGFRLLALLNEKNINYDKMGKIIVNVKIHWNAIKEKVKDENSVDAFNLLFEGLEDSVQTKNSTMIKILAELDLALVDIIEKKI